MSAGGAAASFAGSQPNGGHHGTWSGGGAGATVRSATVPAGTAGNDTHRHPTCIERGEQRDLPISRASLAVAATSCVNCDDERRHLEHRGRLWLAVRHLQHLIEGGTGVALVARVNGCLTGIDSDQLERNEQELFDAARSAAATFDDQVAWSPVAVWAGVGTGGDPQRLFDDDQLALFGADTVRAVFANGLDGALRDRGDVLEGNDDEHTVVDVLRRVLCNQTDLRVDQLRFPTGTYRDHNDLVAAWHRHAVDTFEAILNNVRADTRVVRIEGSSRAATHELNSPIPQRCRWIPRHCQWNTLDPFTGRFDVHTTSWGVELFTEWWKHRSSRWNVTVDDATRDETELACHLWQTSDRLWRDSLSVAQRLLTSSPGNGRRPADGNIA